MAFREQEPSEEDFVEKVLPVEVVTEIVAPGMTAPVSSLTRPRSGVSWASAVSAETGHSRRVRLLNLMDLYKCILTSFAPSYI
jgi:hypothetical protein